MNSDEHLASFSLQLFIDCELRERLIIHLVVVKIIHFNSPHGHSNSLSLSSCVCCDHKFIYIIICISSNGFKLDWPTFSSVWLYFRLLLNHN